MHSIIKSQYIPQNISLIYKKILYIGIFNLLLYSCQQHDATGQIAVAGYAEKKIAPNEFYLTVSLREYYKEELSSPQNTHDFHTLAIDIMNLEKQWLQQLNDLGVPYDTVYLENANSIYLWNNNIRSIHPVRTRTYQVMVSNLQLANYVLNMPLAFGSTVRLERVSHSNLEAIEQEVQHLALENAKHKATNLIKNYAKIIGIIFISEEQSRITQQQGDTGYIKLKNQPLPSNESLSTIRRNNMDVQQETPHMSDILVSSRVDVVFAIK